MPTADYRCELCEQVFEHEAKDLPLTLTKTHDVSPMLKAICENTELHRVWSKFGIGRGTSGKTPPR